MTKRSMFWRRLGLLWGLLLTAETLVHVVFAICGVPQ